MTDERDPQTFAILGAAMEVHTEVDHGFLEPVDHECFAIELGVRRIPFTHETPFPINYKGHSLRTEYCGDFVCSEQIIVELKALPKLLPTHKAQVINYLRATRLHRGSLLNLGTDRLEWERIVLDFNP